MHEEDQQRRVQNSNLDRDFTVRHYIELLRLAKERYSFAKYSERDQQGIILWRHDCDYSLNRAVRLAQIEHEENVATTYFLNPHCEFYNLLEKGQARLVEDILGYGHQIGLHFDAEFYEVESEEQLEEFVTREASWIKEWFGIQPTVFSFHNPTDFLLSCDHDHYGGLINCYSKSLRSDFSYCSDSNGFWRYTRLIDMLRDTKVSRLQVLTHPGWWQESHADPRSRIFRSVYGRAKSVMRDYDAAIELYGRDNVGSSVENLNFLKELDYSQFELCDYLWSSNQLNTLFTVLWRLHLQQIDQHCKSSLQNEWQIPESEIEALFADAAVAANRYLLFEETFGNSYEEVSGCTKSELESLRSLGELLYSNSVDREPEELETDCIRILECIQGVVDWSIDRGPCPFDADKWELLKSKLGAS